MKSCNIYTVQTMNFTLNKVMHIMICFSSDKDIVSEEEKQDIEDTQEKSKDGEDEDDEGSEDEVRVN